MVCFHFTVSGPILFEALFSEETVELAYSCVYILLCPCHIHSATDPRWTELSFQTLAVELCSIIFDLLLVFLRKRNQIGWILL